MASHVQKHGRDHHHHPPDIRSVIRGMDLIRSSPILSLIRFAVDANINHPPHTQGRRKGARNPSPLRGSLPHRSSPKAPTRNRKSSDLLPYWKPIETQHPSPKTDAFSHSADPAALPPTPPSSLLGVKPMLPSHPSSLSLPRLTNSLSLPPLFPTCNA